MEVRPGYQQTEVGLVPEDWEIQPIREIVERLDAGVSVNSVDEDFKTYAHSQSVLKTSAVTEGRFLPHECKKIAPRDVWRVSLQPRADTILISRMNTPSLVGECGYVEADYEDLFLPDRLWMAKKRPESDASIRWLTYLLSSKPLKARIAALATGTSGSMKNLAKNALLDLLIATPGPPEQRTIAAALGDVDVLLEGLDRLIAKKRDLKQAAMQQLLTGLTRLTGFHGVWEVVEFGDIATIRNVKVVASSTPPGTQCVELESIDQGTGRLLTSVEARGLASKYSFRKGDVLFGRLRAYLRKYWLATFDGVCSTEIWPLIARDDRLSGSFLHLLVQTNDFVNAAGVSYGTHMPRSDWSVLKKVPVRLPFVPEQAGIVAALSDMDAELTALEARRVKTRDLKQAMMQELLTGKTRLVAAGDAHA